MLKTDQLAAVFLGTLLLWMILVPPAHSQQQLEGSWKGELDVGIQKLPLIFHFKQEGEEWKGTMDSPSQQAKGIPVSKVLYNGLLLTMEINVLQASFEGIFQGNGFQGQFKQAGLSLPLALEKTELTEAEAEPQKRPQEPTGPFPYETIQTTFVNGPEKYALKGTISKPQGQGPFPAVVLVSGSGPQNRDSEIFGHKPFWVIADQLTRKGIVVLRYDERGVGASEGTFKGTTSRGFAQDARAAMERLRGYEFVDKEKIGLIGHSEGGLIAWILGAEGGELPNFLVSLAPPVVNIDELMAQQTLDVILASGGDSSLAMEQSGYNRSIYQAVKSAVDTDAAKKMLESIVLAKGQEMGLEGEALEQHKTQQLGAYQQLLDPWFFAFIKTEPATLIKAIQVPVWAAFGEKDVQVNAPMNQAALMRLLQDHPNTKIQTYPGLNHLFQTADSGAVSEYGEIEETFNPQVIADIASWILGLN
nr:alpha/beta fold hydrolase [Cytophagales bacterium]